MPSTFLLPFCIPPASWPASAGRCSIASGRAPGWLGYGLLALLVVVVSHVLIFGAASIAHGRDRLSRCCHGLGFMLLLHGWLSIPMALLGTAAFVLWIATSLAY